MGLFAGDLARVRTVWFRYLRQNGAGVSRQMAVDEWEILDVGSIWMREFASAMARVQPLVAWWPEMRRLGAFERWEREETIAEPALTVLRYPLQRGYARTPLQQLLP